jgi:hypothetical protein
MGGKADDASFGSNIALESYLRNDPKGPVGFRGVDRSEHP